MCVGAGMGAPSGALLARLQLLLLLIPKLLLLLLNEHLHPALLLILYLWDIAGQLCLYLAQLLVLLHLQLGLGLRGHLLEGSQIVFRNSKG